MEKIEHRGERKNVHDLHLGRIELGSYTRGDKLIAMLMTLKKMILTHGECERLSIVLMFWGGWGERKEKESSSLKLEIVVFH